jgi:hypothetical protein
MRGAAMACITERSVRSGLCAVLSTYTKIHLRDHRDLTHEPNMLRRMVSSGLLPRVALVRTDVSEEPGASFIRVTRIGELGTTQTATSNRRTLRRNTKYFFAAYVGC